MIPTKICNSCEKELPLTEEYFYKNPLTSDGYIDKCIICHKDIMNKKNQIKREQRQKIFDINGKSKVPTLDEYKVKQKQLNTWKRDIHLLCVIRCKYCSNIIEIRKKYHILNCKCGHNLVCFTSINFLWSNILYISSKVKEFCLDTFDPWR